MMAIATQQFPAVFSLADLPRESGIYRMRFLSGPCCIGSSDNINRRCHEHDRDLSHHCHPNKTWQKQFVKVKGRPTAYVWEVLELCPEEMLAEREQFWIDTTNSKLNEMKIAVRACNGPRRVFMVTLPGPLAARFTRRMCEKAMSETELALSMIEDALKEESVPVE